MFAERSALRRFLLRVRKTLEHLPVTICYAALVGDVAGDSEHLLKIGLNLYELLKRVDLCQLVHHLRRIHWIQRILRLKLRGQKRNERIGTQLVVRSGDELDDEANCVFADGGILFVKALGIVIRLVPFLAAASQARTLSLPLESKI